MKIDSIGDLANLKKAAPNKREQLAASPQRTPGGKSVEPAPRSKKVPGVVYRSMRLELPADLKVEVDTLFVGSRELQRLGKNNWLIQAVREKLKSEQASSAPISLDRS